MKTIAMVVATINQQPVGAGTGGLIATSAFESDQQQPPPKRKTMKVCAFDLTCLAHDTNLPSSKLPFAWKLYEMLESQIETDTVLLPNNNNNNNNSFSCLEIVY